jgi:hypothetical protein
MNELFLRPQKIRELIVPPIPNLRFNGDRPAFVNADFAEFIAVCSANVLWLNTNICAYKPTNFDARKNEHLLCEEIGMDHYVILEFDMQYFILMSVMDFKTSDVPLLDMILESLGRRQVRNLSISMLDSLWGMDQTSQIFSTEAIRQFWW